MNAVKEKSEQIKTQGALERGEFNPTGTPLKVYKYWHKNTVNAPKTENFCHFWRVVAIWAPLMWFRRGIQNVAETSVFWIVVIALANIAIIASAIIFTPVILAVYLIPYLIANAIMAALLFEDQNYRQTFDEKDMIYFGIFAFVGTAFYFLVKGLFNGLVWIIDNAPSLSSKAQDRIFYVIVSIFALALAYLYASAYFAFGWTALWWTLVVIAAIVVTLAVGLSLRYIFEYFGEKWSRQAAERARLNEKAWDDYFYGNGPHPNGEARKPGKVAHFFTTVKDFFVLVFNIVRVNKWKICPLVNISEGK